MKVVKLVAKKGKMFHFGINGLDTCETVFHSDSLFSAIINNLAKIKGDISPDYIKNFPRISSAFPFCNNIYFIPFLRTNNKKENQNDEIKEERLDEDRYKLLKKMKKLEFMSTNMINKQISIENIKKEQIINKCIVSEDEIDKIGKEFIQYINEDKTMVPRIIKYNENKERIVNNKLFNVKSFYFTQDKCGLYFIIDDDLKDKELVEAIRMIKYEGLGGKRSIGKGSFKEVKIEDVKEVFNKEFIDALNGQGELYTSLSLVYPKEKEWESSISYNLLERKGYVYPIYQNIFLRKSPIIMFSEGSLFNKRIEGDIKVVIENTVMNINHHIYKYGKAFLISVRRDIYEI